MDLKNRYYGAIFGAIIGDTLGAPVEFKERGSFPLIKDFIDWSYPKGTYTDDSSMMLALMDSIYDCKGINPEDQLNKYVNWYLMGDYSSTSSCFDIGKTTENSLINYICTHELRAPGDEKQLGNGSLMRHLPVPLFMHRFNDLMLTRKSSDVVCSTTHDSVICREYCYEYCKLIIGILNGNIYPVSNDININDVKSTGFVVDTFNAALWAFNNTKSFEDCIVTAVNLGNDADTIGCIAGSLAGAYYGYDFIPENYIIGLRNMELIIDISHKFVNTCLL